MAERPAGLPTIQTWIIAAVGTFSEPPADFDAIEAGQHEVTEDAAQRCCDAHVVINQENPPLAAHHRAF